MIASASRRTDLAALYPEWLMARLRAGFCAVVHPFRPTLVRRVGLAAPECEAIVFWTRNGAPLLGHLDEIEQLGMPFLCLWTLTGYGPPLEPGLPPVGRLIDSFLAFGRRLGPGRLVWRYDPLLVSSVTDLAFHRRHFAWLLGQLGGAAGAVKISLADYYAKVERRLARPELAGIEFERRPELRPELGETLSEMAAAARQAGLAIEACAEEVDLAPFGIRPGACIDPERLSRIAGRPIAAAKDPGQRPACGCARSADIGAYDTCVHGCVYCYAVSDPARAAARHARHDPTAEILIP